MLWRQGGALPARERESRRKTAKQPPFATIPANLRREEQGPMQPGQTPTCRCGYENSGNYCPNCGARQTGTKTTAERSRRPKSWKILLVSGLVGIPLSILAVTTAASCMAESEEHYYQPAEQQNQQSYYQPAGQQNQHAAPARPTSTPRPTPTPRPVTIANGRISLESGEWTEYSIARYRYCDYEIRADTLEIEVDGIRDRCSMPPTAPHHRNPPYAEAPGGFLVFSADHQTE